VLNPVRAFATKSAAKEFFQNASPPAVILPAVVPYIHQQLEYLDLYQDLGGGVSPHDPIRVDGFMIGRNTPALYPFEGEIHQKDPWTLVPPIPTYLSPAPYPDDPALDNCAPEDSLSTMSTTASTVSSSFSTTEERERSKNRMKDLKISSLPTSGEALRKWIMNLKWSLAGDCWCQDGIHAIDIKTTTPATKSLSNDLLSVFKKAVTEHSSSSHQRNAKTTSMG
jgi:hypothetical protein